MSVRAGLAGEATSAGPRIPSPLGWWRTISTAVLVGAAAIFVVGLLAASSSEQIGFDFRDQYFAGALAVGDGRALYSEPNDGTLEQIKAYVYPPQLAMALVPFTVLPEDAAVVLALVLCLAALGGTLAVLGVRDVRCYAAVLLWWPAWNGLVVVNLTAVLAFAIALAWRVRYTLRPLAIVLGIAVSAKLFLWPLLIWAAATRRLFAATLAVAVGTGTTLAAWSAIDFQGLRIYPALLDRLSEIYGPESYSLVGMAVALGYEPYVGHALMLAIGGSLLLAAIEFGREGKDRRAFTCTVVGMLALTPIVWQHYLLLLLAPLALARPRFSPIWLLPIVLWLHPRPGDPDPAQTFLPALVVAIMFAVMLARPRQDALEASR